MDNNLRNLLEVSDIAIHYIEYRKQNPQKPVDYDLYRNQLKKAGVDEERIEDVMIKIDDHRTEQINIEKQLAEYKKRQLLGLLLMIGGFAFTLLSFLDFLEDGIFYIVYLSPICFGILLYFNSRDRLSSYKTNLDSLLRMRETLK